MLSGAHAIMDHKSITFEAVIKIAFLQCYYTCNLNTFQVSVLFSRSFTFAAV